MIDFAVLSGFLGAGKTTTMLEVAERLREEGRCVAIVTNDQGVDLVDTQLAESKAFAVGEVTEGCFCCRFEDLAATVMHLVDERGADVVIAEAVGSCTDIQATVLRPLREYYGDRFAVASLATVVDPFRYIGFERSWKLGEAESDMSYLFRLQLEEADVIALNKTDLLRDDEIDPLHASLAARFPKARVVPYSATNGAGLTELAELWVKVTSASSTELDLDYERYGQAEAKLAWLNRVFEIRARGQKYFAPAGWAESVLREIAETCRGEGLGVGHVKLAIDAPDGMTKASLTGTAVSLDEPGPEWTGRGTVTLNARIECEPEMLKELAAAAVEAASRLGISAFGSGGRAFKPPQPDPTHRLPARL